MNRLPEYNIRIDEGDLKSLKSREDWDKVLLNMREIWDSGITGKGVNVAILDTGVNLSHPDLKNKIKIYDDFTNSPNGIEDENGHGTHCVGSVSANKNELGVIGYAYECNIHVYKVLSDDGFGENEWTADAIRLAVDNGADVISLSLGSRRPHNKTYSEIMRAIEQGIIVIAAAGNEGDSGLSFPARHDEVIAAGSINKELEVSNFSSIGRELDIVAPGENIYNCYKRGRYAYLSGTSMASPIVAAIAALTKQVKPSINQYEFIDLIKSTAKDIGEIGKDNYSGCGIINPAKMLINSDIMTPKESNIFCNFFKKLFDATTRLLSL